MEVVPSDHKIRLCSLNWKWSQSSYTPPWTIDNRFHGWKLNVCTDLLQGCTKNNIINRDILHKIIFWPYQFTSAKVQSHIMSNHHIRQSTHSIMSFAFVTLHLCLCFKTSPTSPLLTLKDAKMQFNDHIEMKAPTPSPPMLGGGVQGN